MSPLCLHRFSPANDSPFLITTYCFAWLTLFSPSHSHHPGSHQTYSHHAILINHILTTSFSLPWFSLPLFSPTLFSPPQSHYPGSHYLCSHQPYSHNLILIALVLLNPILTTSFSPPWFATTILSPFSLPLLRWWEQRTGLARTKTVTVRKGVGTKVSRVVWWHFTKFE